MKKIVLFLMTMVITMMLAFPALAETTGPPNDLMITGAVSSWSATTVSDSAITEPMIDTFTKNASPVITVLHPVPVLECIFPVITVLHTVPVIICIDKKKTPTLVQYMDAIDIFPQAKAAMEEVWSKAKPASEMYFEKAVKAFIHPKFMSSAVPMITIWFAGRPVLCLIA